VRKSHFLFGTDTHPMEPYTPKSHMTPFKSVYQKVSSNQMGAAQTNIQIYHNGVAAGENRFTSTYCSSNSLHANPMRLSQRATQPSFSRRLSAQPSSD